MKKLLTLILGMILLFTIIPMVSSEMTLWNSVIKDETNSLVKYHAFYTFEDTSAKSVGKNKDIPITLYYVIEPLPYALTGGSVDWCNLTTNQFQNNYDKEGNLENTTADVRSLYFSGGGLSTGTMLFNMRSRDSLIADITCHYTDVNYLYDKNILVGRFTTYIPSFECATCTQYTLEELSQQIDKQEEITANELAIYDKIQTALDWNFQIWLVLSWIIKIAFVLIAVSLVFMGVYYFYIFLRKIGEEI